jgi:hypothetical protein
LLSSRAQAEEKNRAGKYENPEGDAARDDKHHVGDL